MILFKNCSKCGLELIANQVFCPSCQHFLDQGEESFHEKRKSFLVKGASFDFVLVEAGAFTLETSFENKAGLETEHSGDFLKSLDEPTRITLNSFYLLESPMTAKQAKALDPYSLVRNEEQAVFSAPRHIGLRLAKLLEEQIGLPCRLPTEAEWIYAAFGGNQSKGYQYAGSNNIEEVAWYSDNAAGNPLMLVKQKKANELGLYDMSGLEVEWCLDCLSQYGLRKNKQLATATELGFEEEVNGKKVYFPYLKNPLGENSGYVSQKGGSVRTKANNCKPYNHNYSAVSNYGGFRLAFSVPGGASFADMPLK